MRQIRCWGNVLIGIRRALRPTLSVALILAAILLKTTGADTSPSAPKNSYLALKTPTPSAVSPSLSCAQVPLLGQWSLEHHVVGIENTATKKFSNQLAVKILETLDPHRVLFTEEHVEDLQAHSLEAWKQVVNKRRCDGFEKWVNKNLPLAKRRLYAYIQSAKLSTKKLSKNASDSLSHKFEGYDEFAESNSDLMKRTGEFVNQILKTGYPKLLKAYNNNLKLFVKDATEQVIEDPVPVGDLLAKAMLKAVDGYSNFLSTNEYEEFYDDLAGGASGIGVKIRKTPNGLLVEKVLPDSPAKKSGKILSGDLIVKVDGTDMKPLDLQESKKRLKGEPGKKVKLTLERISPSHNLKFSVTLKRSRFDFEEGVLKHESHQLSGKKIVSVKIPSFYGRGSSLGNQDERSVSEDLEKLIRKHRKDQPQAMVIDLRDNPGGYLEEAVSMAGLFLGDKTIAGVLERNSRRVFKNDFQEPLYTGSVVVLLDSGSASAAEVFAGALKDYSRAVLVGSANTYGKGTVQRLYHVEDELKVKDLSGQLMSGVIKLTTSIFYSPLGHSPAKGGVSTHITLLPTTESKSRPKLKNLAKLEYDVSPFVSEKEAEKLKLLKKDNAPQIAKLKSDSEKRFESSDKGQESESKVLDEAVTIAAQLAELEKKSPVAHIAE